jgi:endonuclease/exonuclease/phosphatase family metal-dependent hydrolase
MRILSLNAWGGRLHEPLIPYLASANPDVLCLQEVVHTPLSGRDWLDYRDDGMQLPQRANLFGEIAAALPDHRDFFCPAARGDLYDGDKRVPSEWGLATFVRNDLAVIGQAQDFVHGEFSPDGFGEHPRSRNAHAVRVFDFEAGLPVTIAHTHGLRDVAGKQDTPARESQAVRLAELIRHTWREGERLVVCGDFNVLPGSSTFDRLSELGLTDLVTARGHDDTRTSFYEKTPRFADYMLVNDAAKVRDFQVVAEPEVSDHRALLLELG